MPWTYYIDGYNVLLTSPRLRPLAGADFEAARHTLIEKAARLCEADGSQATVVFDGQGQLYEPARPAQGPSSVAVVYSVEGQTADSVIERAVYLAPDRGAVVVVTADREEREVCSALGALTMAPKHFLASVDEARADLAARLERVRNTHAPHQIQDHLDTAARDHLDGLREKLPEQEMRGPVRGPRAPRPIELPDIEPFDPDRASDTLRNRIGIRALDRLEQLHAELSALRAAQQQANAPKPEQAVRHKRIPAPPAYVSGVSKGALSGTVRGRLTEIRNTLNAAEKKPAPPSVPRPQPKKRKAAQPEPAPPAYVSGKAGGGLNASNLERLTRVREALTPPKASAPAKPPRAKPKPPNPPAPAERAPAFGAAGLDEDAQKRLQELRNKLSK